MRIHITVDNPPTQDPEVVLVHPDNIDSIEPSSCTEVNLGDTLDKVRNRDFVLARALSKVRYKGKLYVSGIDLNVFSRQLFNGHYTYHQINNILYNGNSSISSHEETWRIIQRANFHLVKTRIDDMNFYLEAERPSPHE